MFKDSDLHVVDLAYMEHIYALPNWLSEEIEDMPSNSPHLKGPEWDELLRFFPLPTESPLAHESEVYLAVHGLYDLVCKVCRGMYRAQGGRGDGPGVRALWPQEDSDTVNEDEVFAYRSVWVMSVPESDQVQPKEMAKIFSAETKDEKINDFARLLYKNSDRRFGVGMTMEETKARLWLATRSGVLVNEGFDIKSNRKSLFRALAFFAFADDEVLGQDPTMVDEGDGFYTTVIGNGRYKLRKKPLADHRARYLVGSAVRVYEAFCVNEDASRPRSTDVHWTEGTRVAIKDMWREEDKKPEHEIYNEVMQSIRNIPPEQLPAGYRDPEDYFVKISVGEDVKVDGKLLDSTRNIVKGIRPEKAPEPKAVDPVAFIEQWAAEHKPIATFTFDGMLLKMNEPKEETVDDDSD